MGTASVVDDIQGSTRYAGGIRPEICSRNAHAGTHYALYWVQGAKSFHRRNMLEVQVGSDTQTATLAWLVSALERARTQGQFRAVGYLEAVAADVVFEMEMAARRASLVG